MKYMLMIVFQSLLIVITHLLFILEGRASWGSQRGRSNEICDEVGALSDGPETVSQLRAECLCEEGHHPWSRGGTGVEQRDASASNK